MMSAERMMLAIRGYISIASESMLYLVIIEIILKIL